MQPYLVRFNSWSAPLCGPYHILECRLIWSSSFLGMHPHLVLTDLWSATSCGPYHDKNAGSSSPPLYVHAKNFVSMPHSWPWHEHSCPFSPCPYPPHSALLLERVIQWPLFIGVNHYINTLSHKDFPWLGHGTDFFFKFLNRDCAKNYRYVRFSHYAHVILHIEKPRKKHHEQGQQFKKKGPDRLLSTRFKIIAF